MEFDFEKFVTVFGKQFLAELDRQLPQLPSADRQKAEGAVHKALAMALVTAAPAGSLT